MAKKCPECGRFMRLTDLMPEDDEFDEELARECGLSEEAINNGWGLPEGPAARFRYVQDQWECGACHLQEWHVEGKRYYWNEASGNYDAPKPLTLKERWAKEREAQEAAGQIRLPL